MLTQNRLKELLDYCPETGVFRWRITDRRKKAGKESGCVNSAGYLQIVIDKKHYKCHRLAWLYMYGSFPEGEIDHINRAKTDNRIANLRVVTRSQNQFNKDVIDGTISGVRGVVPSGQKWRAQISVGGRTRYIGTFENLEQATIAYLENAKKYRGEFVYA